MLIKSENNNRADRGVAALVGYAEACGKGNDDDMDADEFLTDLLTDLRHWARRGGVSFDDAAEVSRLHFEQEA